MRGLSLFVAGLCLLCLSGSVRAAESVRQAPVSSVVVVEGGNRAVPVRVVRQSASADRTAPEETPEETLSAAAAQGAEGAIPITPMRQTPPAGAGVGRWTPNDRALLVEGVSPSDPLLWEEGLRRLVQDGFTRILTVFDTAADNLSAFAFPSDMAGMKVDLVLRFPRGLSDTSWDDAASRLEFFRSYAFFRWVIFDLSAADVGNRADAERLVSGLERLAAAADRPVGVIIDPRALEQPFGDFIASAFYRLNLKEIALPLFSTDAGEVVRRFQSLCRFYIDLPFSLIQSVSEERPRTESYFTAGVSILQMRMKRLCFDTSASNAQDLIIDGLEDYLRMAP